MSRFYRNEEEQRGYDDREEEGRLAPYPYERSHDYRECWDGAAEDERREQRREEEREQLEEAERIEEKRQYELIEDIRENETRNE